MILLGMCANLERAALLKEIGYDYIELNMARTAALPEDEFAELLSAARQSGLPVYAMNVLLPGSTYPLCSDELDQDGLVRYLNLAFLRAKALGVKAVSFGSSGARRVPDGMDTRAAMEKLALFLRLAGPIAAKNGVTIAIEPLRAQECNIINSVSEARELAALANIQGVGVLADLYHMLCQNEGFEGVLSGPLAHCHIAEGKNRRFPMKGDGCEGAYRGFFRSLLSIGYEGGISIEGGSDQFEADARASFALLSELRKEEEAWSSIS